MQNGSNQCSAHLSDNSSCGSPGNAHFRHTEKSEYHNRVKYNINDSANSLRNHGINGFARTLQGLFKNEL